MNEFVNQIICGDWIKELKKLPTGIFHLVVTSPGYWGQRDYGWGGNGSCYDKKRKMDIHLNYINHSEYDHLEICPRCFRTRPKLGLEKTLEEHIEKLVEGFREVRRVLRDDGVLFLNYGDKYSDGGRKSYDSKQISNSGLRQSSAGFERNNPFWAKQGDLLMLPVRVAMALQADGWILRDDIIWAKAISSFGMHECPHCGKELYQEIEQGRDLFGDEIEDEIVNHKKSGSTMPESVNGTRWERHRIKVEKAKKGKGKLYYDTRSSLPHPGAYGPSNPTPARYIDCPGCEKCEPNGGLVLRKGSWRCTKAHEHVFQLVKSNDYFCDMEAVREEMQAESKDRYEYGFGGKKNEQLKETDSPTRCVGNREAGTGRNLRNVWAVNPRGYSDAHYATFPEDLVEPMIKVATSQRGVCPKCGAQWARIVEKKAVKRNRPNDRTDRHNQGGGVNSCGNTVAGVETITLGFKATCECGIEETVPALVLDPFMGSGTVAVKAIEMNRNYVGIDVNPNYCKDHAEIRCRAVEHGMSPEEVKAGQKVLFE